MGKRAVFLDRDGTILQLIPYLHEADRVRLLPGVAESLRRLGEAGYGRILVTNQSGVARGWFGMDDVEGVHDRLLYLLRAEGADLDGIEICPHHPDHTGPCSCRKPASGMIERAALRFGLSLKESWVIGDRMDDLLAGAALGCRGILVLTGYGQEEARLRDPARLADACYVAHDLAAAVAHLIAVDGSVGPPA